ncbi:hypothetical protein ACFLX2_00285 [Candidatus Dependentiae bacterium]
MEFLVKNLKKKLIFRPLLAISLLLGASQACGMTPVQRAIVKGLTITGRVGNAFLAGTAGLLGKRYLYDPIRTMKKYREFRADQEVQDLSDEALDDATDQTSWGDRLHTWYLKRFGYNTVYVNDSDNSLQLSSGAAVRRGGGTFMQSRIVKNSYLRDWYLRHENEHLHNRDVTQITYKTIFRIPFSRFSISPFSPIFPLHNTHQEEVLAESGSICGLYRKKRISAFVHAVLSNFQINKNYPDCPYGQGGVLGFEKIREENPGDTLLASIDDFDSARVRYNECYNRMKQAVSERQPSSVWIHDLYDAACAYHRAGVECQSELHQREEDSAIVPMEVGGVLNEIKDLYQKQLAYDAAKQQMLEQRDERSPTKWREFLYGAGIDLEESAISLQCAMAGPFGFFDTPMKTDYDEDERRMSMSRVGVQRFKLDNDCNVTVNMYENFFGDDEEKEEQL